MGEIEEEGGMRQGERERMGIYIYIYIYIGALARERERESQNIRHETGNAEQEEEGKDGCDGEARRGQRG